MEPEILKKGKEFHKKVQEDWLETAKDGKVFSENTILLSDLKNARKSGRIDIFVNDLGDFVSVIEIKSTNWDKVKEKNRKKLLSSHRWQVWKYMDKYLDIDRVDVYPGIIYPNSPSTPGLKIFIENYLNDFGLQVVWYYDWFFM